MGIVYQNQADAGALTGNLTADINKSQGSASFTVGNIFFDSENDGSTLDFFTNAGRSGFTGFTNEKNGFSADATIDNTITVLTAQTYLEAGENSFIVGHDDGVVLKIPGINYTLSDGGPTSFTNTPFMVDNTKAAGLYSFTLEYGECCGPPAELEFTINGNPVGVPEPATLGVFVLGLVSLAGLRRFATPPA